MNNTIELKNPPLTEIIFSISFKESLTEEILVGFKNNSTIKKNFPTINDGYHADLIGKEGMPPTSNISHDGFIFSCDIPFKKILQIRKGTLSFHILKQYVQFDKIINELNTYWELLNNLSKDKLNVSGYSIRYLNFLEIDDREKFEDIITMYSVNPFDNIDNLFLLHRFSYEDDKNIKVNVIASNGNNENSKGILLDIILNKKNEKEFVINDLYSMREAKNSIFRKSITEKTLEKYS